MNRFLSPASRRRAPVAVLLPCALLLPVAVLAGAGPAPTERTPAPASAVPAAFGPPLAPDALEAVRGGDRSERRVDNTVAIDGTLDGNSARDIASGDNRVQGDAFGHAAGINTLIQNTGSNVLIQNGMTVNVQFAAPGTP